METACLVAQAARPESSGTLAEASACLPWPLQAASPAATLKKECCQSYYSCIVSNVSYMYIRVSVQLTLSVLVLLLHTDFSETGV